MNMAQVHTERLTLNNQHSCNNAKYSDLGMVGCDDGLDIGLDTACDKVGCNMAHSGRASFNMLLKKKKVDTWAGGQCEKVHV